MDPIIFSNVPLEAAVAGAKAAALSKLQQARLPVPEWFVILPPALETLLSATQLTQLTSSSDAEISDLFESLSLHAEQEQQIYTAYDLLVTTHPWVAVRSSVSEDSVQHPHFSGLLERFLFVNRQALISSIKKVWASAFMECTQLYRRELGVTQAARAPAILIQCMIDADVAGVAYAVEPLTGDRDIRVVTAVFGLGSALADKVDADTYHVDRAGQIIKRALRDKRVAHRRNPCALGGIAVVPVAADKRNKPSLDYGQVREVAELARHCSEYFGHPQEIEWAYAEGQLFLLQSRPISTVGSEPSAQGELNLWDNAPIAESYSGTTTPLTFSFAQRVTEEMYREFCRVLRVPCHVIALHDRTFKRLLGLMRGRIYYNVLSWYRVLAMLPGFASNQKFVEKMLGVKEALPPEVLRTVDRRVWRRWLDRLRFLGSLLGLVVNHFLVHAKIRQFYRRVANAVAWSNPKLQKLRADELSDYYRFLERELLTRWDAPIINDFFAMIFYRALGRLTTKWCDYPAGNLQNDLLCGEGGMISAEAAQRVRAMAALVENSASAIQVLQEGTQTEIEQLLITNAELRTLYEAYVEKFGDRCLDELKLESETLHDNPMILLRSIGHLAAQKKAATDPMAVPADLSIRRTAEEHILRTLGKSWFRKKILFWVLKHARARVRDRENLRFERARLFGRVRRLFSEIGIRFKQAGVLAQPRDIFFLEVNEVLGFVEGTCSSTHLQGLADLRRREFQAYEAQESPADRFETYGVVHFGNSFKVSTAAATSVGAEALQGVGCCSGVVRGKVRVIRNPYKARLFPGEILVAERIDPGWIMLFPAAAGILVERGSLLSHAVVVAREMAIPCVVAVSGVTHWLKDGNEIELDGASGVVRKLPLGADLPRG